MSDLQYLQFEDAVPVQRARGGKTATPNPYTEIVATIAGQYYPADTTLNGIDVSGQPVSKRFMLTHTIDPTVLGLEAGTTHDENGVSIVDRIIARDRQRVNRQMSEAGGKNEPPVTVRVVHEDANTEEQRRPGQPKETVYRTKVTFWTTKRKGSGNNEAPADSE